METKLTRHVIHNFLLIASLLLGPIAFGHGPVQSQKSKDSKTSPEATVQEEERQQQILRIVAILRATSDGAMDWTDAAAASKIQAQIADSIWDFDPDAGRTSLIKAWETASRADYPKSQERSRYRNASLRAATGREVILVARKRAPELAQKWLDQIAEQMGSDRASEERGLVRTRIRRRA